MIYRPLILIKTVPNSKKWWMDSNGKLIDCAITHLITAVNLTKNINDPIGILWRGGWQRVCNYPDGPLYCENELTLPNTTQKFRLIELAQEYEKSKIIYDMGKKSVVIWSKGDII